MSEKREYYESKMKKIYEKYKLNGCITHEGESWVQIKEECHIEADNLLCEILEDLGFEEIIQTYKKMEKWYT